MKRENARLNLLNRTMLSPVTFFNRHRHPVTAQLVSFKLKNKQGQNIIFCHIFLHLPGEGCQILSELSSLSPSPICCLRTYGFATCDVSMFTTSPCQPQGFDTFWHGHLHYIIMSPPSFQKKVSSQKCKLRTMVMVSIHTIMFTTSSCPPQLMYLRAWV